MVEKEKSKVDEKKNELMAEEFSFWAFTGRWAIILIIVGLVLLFTEQIMWGILVIALALGYIIFRMQNIKRRAKKINIGYPAWWQGTKKFFFVAGIVIFMIVMYVFWRFAFRYFGIIGVIILIAILYGYWYLWKETKLSVLKKSLISLLPIIVIVIIYVSFIGIGTYNYFQDLNANMESQNIEVSNSVEDVTIENKEFGFKITHPSNWYKDSIFRENIILQLKPNDNSASITLKKYDADFVSQEEYMQYTTKEDLTQIFKETNQIELISVEDFKVDNMPTFKITYYENAPTISGEQKFKVISIYLIRKNNQMMGINYVATPEDFDSKLSDALTIINSMKFQ